MIVRFCSEVLCTRLLGCMPNPFDRTTAINYQLGSAGSVALTLHDVAGRAVRRLACGPQPAGFHSVVWNGKDDRGRALPAGVYFCRMQSGSTTESRRVTLVR
ncbi:T9SS type A sorting domain-containing protein [candidate division WOR-3 bacterium]|nr:T9SS type A sorting domain-containing protein [candidate division WOR-3 bacterium]